MQQNNVAVTPLLFHALHDAREVLRFYRDLVASAPDEVTLYAGLLPTPHGPVVAVAAAHCGSLEEGARALAPLTGLSVGTEQPLADGLRVRTAAAGELAAHWPEASGLLPSGFGREPRVRTCA